MEKIHGISKIVLCIAWSYLSRPLISNLSRYISLQLPNLSYYYPLIIILLCDMDAIQATKVRTAVVQAMAEKLNH